MHGEELVVDRLVHVLKAWLRQLSTNAECEQPTNCQEDE